MEMMAPVAVIRIIGAAAVVVVLVQQAIVVVVLMEIHMLEAPEELVLRLRLQALRLFMLAVAAVVVGHQHRPRQFMRAELAEPEEEVQVLRVTLRQRLELQILEVAVVAVD
jgi:hypothetical protein